MLTLLLHHTQYISLANIEKQKFPQINTLTKDTILLPDQINKIIKSVG